MRQAIHHPCRDGVAGVHDHHRDVSRALLRDSSGWIAASHDEIDVVRDHLVKHSRQPIKLPLRPIGLEDDRLFGDVAAARERLFEDWRKNAATWYSDMQ